MKKNDNNNMKKMRKKVGFIAIILLVILAFLLFINIAVNEDDSLNILIDNILVSSVALVAIFVVSLLGLAALKSKKDDPHALGLPAGSVRAIIAVSIIVLFILISLYFFHVIDAYPNDSAKVEIAKNILTILGTLAVAVSSFYFSAKATQQGIDAATKAFQNNNEDTGSLDEAIIDAIAKNEKDWKKKYKIEEAKIGKKQSEGNQLEIKCIVFWVKEKEIPTEKSQEIPKLVTHTFKGKVYEIITDVRKRNFNKKAVTLNIIEKSIKKYQSVWLKKYGAESVMATMKEENDTSTSIPCAQFSVEVKDDQVNTEFEQIPEYIHVDGYEIPTDVLEEEIPTQDSTTIQPGDAIHRKDNSDDNGTLGLKVYREDGSGNPTEHYILSCYHVLCSIELNNKITRFNGSTGNTDIIHNGSKIGNVVEGYIGKNLDAAIAKIDAGVSLLPSLKNFPNAPKNGIKKVTNRDSKKSTKVYSYGAKSGEKSGKIKAARVDRKIEIDGKKIQFENIIATTKISVPGDSGAAVIDEANKVVGIVFASSNIRSYIIPISEIIHQFKIKINYA